MHMKTITCTLMALPLLLLMVSCGQEEPTMKATPTPSLADLQEGTQIVEFWAEWCGPCKLMAPIVSKWEEQTGMSVHKVNVDHDTVLSKEFKVTAIPVMVVLKDGKEVDRITGVMPLEQLTERLPTGGP